MPRAERIQVLLDQLISEKSNPDKVKQIAEQLRSELSASVQDIRHDLMGTSERK